MKKLLIIFALVLLASCKSQKVASVEEHTTVKDSTVVTFQPVDTIISIPADSLKLRVNIEELTEVPVVHRNDRMSVKLSKVGNDVVAECNVDELEKRIELLKKLVERYKNTETVRTETIVEKERYVPFLIKVLAWIGGIFASYGFLKLLIRIQNPFSK